MRRSNMSSIAYIMMWATLWSWAYGQSTTVSRVATSQSAVVSASASAFASPTANSTLKFDPIPTLTTCQTAR